MPVKVTGVSFDGAHSYNDWGLKLKSVSIGVPKAKTVSRCMPLVLQQLIAASGITVTEFISGLILNVWLGMNMWDYSNMPGNILGQICPQFTLLWFFLSAFGIFLDDLIRWLLFGEEKPHYHLFRKRKGDK